MKSYLSVIHLVRHYLLFVFTVVFLLSIARAGYCLWHLQKFSDTQTLVQVFLQGIRFDAASIGILLIVPVVLIPLLSISRWSLWLARSLSVIWLLLAMCFVLLSELMTPYFLADNGLRPDLNALFAIENPQQVFNQLRTDYLIPFLVGVVLVLLILFAFWRRLETSRFLRYPVKALPAILLSLVGAALCFLAIKSSFDLDQPMLDASAALVSTESVVNEIALSSPFKMLSVFTGSLTQVQSLLPASLFPTP